MYVKRRDFSGGATSSNNLACENEAKKIIYIALKDNKSVEFDEDEMQIF